MQADIRYYDEVDSTNTVLMKLADEGAAEGTCVVASYQSNGQGRSGRTFYSPSGNLYMSLLLRPDNEKLFQMITVIAGVAAVEAIKESYGVKCGIKWVNDIFLDGRKAGGIVAKAYGNTPGDRYVVLGIGINIYEDSDVPDEIKDVYTSITGRRKDKECVKSDLTKLALKITERFSYYYDRCLIKEEVDEYRKMSCVIGKTVEYISGPELFTAKVCAISDDGGLILETKAGQRTFRDGEIRIRQVSQPCEI